MDLLKDPEMVLLIEWEEEMVFVDGLFDGFID